MSWQTVGAAGSTLWLNEGYYHSTEFASDARTVIHPGIGPSDDKVGGLSAPVIFQHLAQCSAPCHSPRVLHSGLYEGGANSGSRWARAKEREDAKRSPPVTFSLRAHDGYRHSSGIQIADESCFERVSELLCAGERDLQNRGRHREPGPETAADVGMAESDEFFLRPPTSKQVRHHPLDRCGNAACVHTTGAAYAHTTVMSSVPAQL
jgi:hypothetical protein